MAIFTPRVFQSTHPVGGATYRHKGKGDTPQEISIHAPRGGCDAVQLRPPPTRNISIHAPRGGCDPMDAGLYPDPVYFNPRTPWGVRQCSLGPLHRPVDISIHAPRGGCDSGRTFVSRYFTISIHAPLTGCDPDGRGHESTSADFNPRTPHGVRPSVPKSGTEDRNFNPRTPHGVRLWTTWSSRIRRRFQSTHPSRGATRP